MTQNIKKYDSEVQELLKRVAQDRAEKRLEQAPYQPNSLMPFDVYKHKLTYEAESDLMLVVDQIIIGLGEIEQALARYESEFSPEVKGELSNLIQKSVMVQKHALAAYIATETQEPLSTQMKLSNDSLQALYRIASELFNDGSYPQATQVFVTLTILNPLIMDFWTGLGNAHYFSQKYMHALLSYNFAAKLEPDNPMHCLYAAHCLENLKDYDQAIEYLDIALERISDNPAYKEWEQKTIDYKNLLLEMKRGSSTIE